MGSTTIEIALTWQPVGADDYVVERSESCDFSNPSTYTVSGAVNAYGDTGKQPTDRRRFDSPWVLQPGVTYNYRVRAEFAGGSEMISNCISGQLTSGPERGVEGDLYADIVLGQPDFGQNDFRKSTDAATQWAGGVLIDRTHTPNRMYVADTNHNRVLGFDHTGLCAGSGPPCSVDADCPGGSACRPDPALRPQVVLGQPSFIDHGACNGDGTAQLYPERAPASRTSLCLMYPLQISVGETIFASMMAIDSQGALYVPDIFNHRVLKYDDPLATDGVANDVWGQADFTGNSCNRGDHPTADTLCLAGTARHAGVAIDNRDNLWVADADNARVLRFPRNGASLAHTADIVLGQQSFTTNTRGGEQRSLAQMWMPLDIAFDPANGRLYVADAGATTKGSRILEFRPPFHSGMAAARKLRIPFFCDIPGFQVQPMSLTFDTQRHGLWVENSCFFTELFSLGGGGARIRVKVPQSDGVDVNAQGDLYVVSKWYDLYQFPRGDLGLDYAANDLHRTVIFPGGRNAPSADAFYFGGGITGFGNQLIDADVHRLLIWNDYRIDQLHNGQAADDLWGEPDFQTEAFQQYLAYPQSFGGDLWVVSRAADVDLLVFAPPLTHDSTPIDVIPLTSRAGFTGYPVLGCPGAAACDCAGNGCNGASIFAKNADQLDFAPAAGGDEIWVADRWNNRVFRIANRLGQRDPARGPFVDVVLGQPDLATTGCNNDRGRNAPSAASLCYPYDLTLDDAGNLWIADNGNENGSNGRMLEFDADLFSSAPGQTVARFGVAATRVLGTGGDFNTTGLLAASDPLISPFKPVFDPQGHMIVGNNPYMTQRMPLVFLNPLADQLPQLALGDLLTYPSGSSFVDADGNLFLSGSNWSRVLVYKRPFAQIDFSQPALPLPASTHTPTPTSSLPPTATPTATPVCGAVETPVVKVYRNPDPAGDEGLLLIGDLPFTGSIDPVASGFSFTVLDAQGAVVFTRSIPPGPPARRGAPGWRINRTGTRWTFVDSHGLWANGIRRVVLRPLPSSSPEYVSFRVRGRHSNFQVKAEQLPLHLFVTLGDPAGGTGHPCGRYSFSSAVCGELAGGQTLRCE